MPNPIDKFFNMAFGPQAKPVSGPGITTPAKPKTTTARNPVQQEFEQTGRLGSVGQVAGTSSNGIPPGSRLYKTGGGFVTTDPKHTPLYNDVGRGMASTVGELPYVYDGTNAVNVNGNTAPVVPEVPQTFAPGIKENDPIFYNQPSNSFTNVKTEYPVYQTANGWSLQKVDLNDQQATFKPVTQTNNGSLSNLDNAQEEKTVGGIPLDPQYFNNTKDIVATHGIAPGTTEIIDLAGEEMKVLPKGLLTPTSEVNWKAIPGSAMNLFGKLMTGASGMISSYVKQNGLSPFVAVVATAMKDVYYSAQSMGAGTPVRNVTGRTNVQVNPNAPQMFVVGPENTQVASTARAALAQQSNSWMATPGGQTALMVAGFIPYVGMPLQALTTFQGHTTYNMDGQDYYAVDPEEGLILRADQVQDYQANGREIRLITPLAYNQLMAQKARLDLTEAWKAAGASWNQRMGEIAQGEFFPQPGHKVREGWGGVVDVGDIVASSTLLGYVADKMIHSAIDPERHAENARLDQMDLDWQNKRALGDIKGAVEAAIARINFEREIGGKTGVMDQYGTYTQYFRPEYEKAYIRAVAEAMVEKGAPLTYDENYNLQQHFVDPGIEFAGQMANDWTMALMHPIGQKVALPIIRKIGSGLGHLAQFSVGGFAVKEMPVSEKLTPKIEQLKATYRQLADLQSNAKTPEEQSAYYLQRGKLVDEIGKLQKQIDKGGTIRYTDWGDNLLKPGERVISKGYFVPGVGHLVQMFTTDAIRSQANKMRYSAFEFANDYAMVSQNSDDFIRDIGQAGMVLRDGIPVDAHGQAVLTFIPEGVSTRGSTEMLKVAQQLGDTAEYKKISPENWQQLAQDAYERIHDDYKTKAIDRLIGEGMTMDEAEPIAEQQATAFAQNPKNISQEFANQFSKVFLEKNKVMGTSLTKDSVLYKTIVALSPKNEEGKPKIGWFGQLAIKAYTGYTDHMYRWWVQSLLQARPAWVARNYIDMMYRYLVFGGGLTDQLGRGIKALDVLQADEFMAMYKEVHGAAPEMTQAMARAELSESMDTVPQRYAQGWRPQSILDFFAYDYSKNTRPDVETVLAGKEGLSKAITLAGHVLGRGKDYGTSFLHGMMDFQSAIEFAFRTRIFFKQFQENMGHLTAQLWMLMSEHPDQFDVTPENQQLLQKIYLKTMYDPQAVRDIAHSLRMGNTDHAALQASLLIPENMESMFKNFTPAQRVQLIDHLAHLVERKNAELRAEGKSLMNPTERKAFFDELDRQVDELGKSILNPPDTRTNPDLANVATNANAEEPPQPVPGDAVDPANDTEAPPIDDVEMPESVARARVAGAVTPEQMVSMLRDGHHIPIQVATAENAPVIAVVKDAQGVHIEVSQAWSHLNKADAQAKLADALTEWKFKQNENELLAGHRFANLKDFATQLKRMITDPDTLHAESPDQFNYLSILLDADANLRNSLAKMLGQDPVALLYNNFASESDIAEAETRTMLANAGMDMEHYSSAPAEYRLAGKQAARAHVGLGEAVETLGRLKGPEFGAYLLELGQTVDRVRSELKSFMVNYMPGPAFFTDPNYRKARWDTFWAVGTQMYERQKDFFNAQTLKVANLEEAPKMQMSRQELDRTFGLHVDFDKNGNPIKMFWSLHTEAGKVVPPPQRTPFVIKAYFDEVFGERIWDEAARQGATIEQIYTDRAYNSTVRDIFHGNATDQQLQVLGRALSDARAMEDFRAEAYKTMVDTGQATRQQIDDSLLIWRSMATQAMKSTGMTFAEFQGLYGPPLGYESKIPIDPNAPLDVLYFQEQRKAIWYTKTLQLSNLVPAKIKAGDFANYLTGHGVKVEELKWTGLQKWIDEDPNRVLTKEEIQAHIAEGSLRIVPRERIYYKELPQEAINRISGIKKDYDLAMRQLEAIDQKIDEIDNTSLSERVRQNRLELLEGQRRSLVDRMESYNTLMEKTQQEYKVTFPRMTLPGKATNYREFVFVIPDLEKMTPGSREFVSGHFVDEKNAIFHSRADIRIDTEGKKNFTFQEGQSDLHQQGAKWGYSTDPEVMAKNDEIQRKITELRAQVDAIYQQVHGNRDIWTKDLIHQRDALNDQLTQLYDSRTYPVPPAPFKDTWFEVITRRMVLQAIQDGADRFTFPRTAQQVAQIEGWPDLKFKDGKYTVHNGNTDVTAIVKRYTEELPQYLEKYLKRYDAKVHPVAVGGGVVYDLVAKGHRPGDMPIHIYYDLDEAVARQKQEPGSIIQSRKLANPEADHLNTIDLTQQMKSDLLNGQPLFQRTSDPYVVTSEREANFKNWFQDSKAVDKQGKPRVFYHGTRYGGFESFDPTFKDPKALYGPGFYFTSDPEIASSYVEKQMPTLNTKPESKAVYPVYVSVQHPLDMIHNDPIPDAIINKIDNRLMREGKGQIPWRFRDVESSGYTWNLRPSDLWYYLTSDSNLTEKQAVEYLKGAGFDGIMHLGGTVMGDKLHDVVIAWEPTQIKSVHNYGTYDPNNPNILYQSENWLNRKYTDAEREGMARSIGREARNGNPKAVQEALNYLDDPNEKRALYDQLWETDAAGAQAYVDWYQKQPVRMNQGTPELVKGMTSLDPATGKWAITLSEKADVSTFVHELTHVYVKILQEIAHQDPSVQGDLEAMLRLSGQRMWNTDAHEYVARAFERFLRDGISPAGEFDGLFGRMAGYMSDIYHTIEPGSALDKPMSNLDAESGLSMRQLFGKWFGVDPLEATAPDRFSQQVLQQLGWVITHDGNLIRQQVPALTPQEEKKLRKQIQQAAQEAMDYKDMHQAQVDNNMPESAEVSDAELKRLIVISQSMIPHTTIESFGEPNGTRTVYVGPVSEARAIADGTSHPAGQPLTDPSIGVYFNRDHPDHVAYVFDNGEFKGIVRPEYSYAPLSPDESTAVEAVRQQMQMLHQKEVLRAVWSRSMKELSKNRPKAAAMIRQEAGDMMLDLYRLERDPSKVLSGADWKTALRQDYGWSSKIVDLLPDDNPRTKLVTEIENLIAGKPGDPKLQKALRKALLDNLENGVMLPGQTEYTRAPHTYFWEEVGNVEKTTLAKDVWGQMGRGDPSEWLDNVMQSHENRQAFWNAFIRQPWYGDKTLADRWGNLAQSPEYFTAYLRDLLNHLDSQGTLGQPSREALQLLLWQVENFNAMSQNFAETLGMTRAAHLLDANSATVPLSIPIHLMPEGTQSWFFANENALSQIAQLKEGIGQWRDWMGKQTEEGLVPDMTLDQTNQFASALTKMADLKQDALDLATRGYDKQFRDTAEHVIGAKLSGDLSQKRVGNAWVDLTAKEKALLVTAQQSYQRLGQLANRVGRMEGALPYSERLSVNYDDFTHFDEMMKNLVPFWMFFSRSTPVWLESFFTHPEILGFYQKYLMYSQHIAYQQGATTTNGDVLPSLDGYIPIPGTQLWFNPLAALSFRYAIPNYRKTFGEEASTGGSIMDAVLNAMNEFGATYGVGLAPWMTAYIATRPNNQYATSALIPQLELLPRWWRTSLLDSIKQGTGARYEWLIGGEVPWQDYLIERRILADQLAGMQGKSDTEKMKLANAAYAALKDRESNTLWNDTKRKMQESELWKSWLGYFTGVYGKPFTDSEAQLMALRDEVNNYKDQINNSVTSKIFPADPDAAVRYQKYINARYSSPEGTDYALYNMIRYTLAPDGTELTGDARRAYINLKIQEDLATQDYNNLINNIQTTYQQKMLTFPVGTPYDQKSQTIDDFYKALNEVETRPEYQAANRNWQIGYKSEMQVIDYMRNLWFRNLYLSEPKWDPNAGEDYASFLKRQEEWYTSIPTLSDSLTNSFAGMVDQRMGEGATYTDHGVRIFNTLFPGQDGRTVNLQNIVNQLKRETQPANYLTWKMMNDTPAQALDKAWTALYWDPYQQAIYGLKGDQRELTSRQWMDANPAPTPQALANWVMTNYPQGKFSMDQVMAATEDRTINTVIDRQAPQTDKEKREQEIWDTLMMAGPTTSQFMKVFAAAGGDTGSFSTWYDSGGNSAAWKDPEKFLDFYNAVMSTREMMGLTDPSTETLQEWTQAQTLNAQWKQMYADQLGADFDAVLSQYLDAGTAMRREIRKADPRIDQYYDLRDAFATQYPVWQTYYYPTFKSGTTSSGGSGSGTGSSGGSGSGYGSGSGGSGGYLTAKTAAQIYGLPPGGSLSKNPDGTYTYTYTPPNFAPMGKRSTLDARRLNLETLGHTSPSGKITVHIVLPALLTKTVGATATGQMLDAVLNLKPLPAVTSAYLSDILTRHPEWQPYIERALKAGAVTTK